MAFREIVQRIEPRRDVDLRDLYRRDPAAYLAEYHRFDADEHGWEREALNIVNAIGYWLGKDQSEAIPHVVAAGFLAAEFETWDETRFATYRLKSLGRAATEREIAAEMGAGWEDWGPVVYQATYLSSELHEFAPPDDSALVEERIPYLRDTVVPAVFSEPLVGQPRDLYSQAFTFGRRGRDLLPLGADDGLARSPVGGTFRVVGVRARVARSAL